MSLRCGRSTRCGPASTAAQWLVRASWCPQPKANSAPRRHLITISASARTRRNVLTACDQEIAFHALLFGEQIEALLEALQRNASGTAGTRAAPRLAAPPWRQNKQSAQVSALPELRAWRPPRLSLPNRVSACVPLLRLLRWSTRSIFGSQSRIVATLAHRREGVRGAACV